MDWTGSPNYTQASNRRIDRIVIHWMAGTLSATDSVFQNTSRQTSAHYGIENGIVHQYVDEKNIAWHAGNGTMNLRSIGIEHSAAPGRDASQETLETSARLIREICYRHGIPIDREHIIKHSEVIATQCPGTIPIDTLIALAKGNENMTRAEAEDMIPVIRIINSQVKGWDFEAVHSGKYDKQETEYLMSLHPKTSLAITKYVEQAIKEGETYRSDKEKWRKAFIEQAGKDAEIANLRAKLASGGDQYIKVSDIYIKK